MLRHVAIIVHRHAPLDGSTYWIGAISDYWREAGVKVSVVSDPDGRVEADIAILHVDLTVIPPNYLAFARNFEITVNAAVTDISKRAISANLLRRDASWDGPVIVKTDRNCYGHPEMKIAWDTLEACRRRDTRSYLEVLRREYRRALRRRAFRRAQASADYRVFGSIAEIPDFVWSDADLVVERFLPEMSQGRYCVRTWLFLGDHDRHSIFYANDPIVKANNIVDFERLADVPDELRQMRERLKFDFGKFDYTMVEGRPMLFDANRTPAFGAFPEERYRPIARTLADGLASLSKSAADPGP